jgi:DNA-binding transcriptional LysR family regulator
LQTIRHFEIVQTLATHQHFGRAAAALGISQPSLTRTLGRIEEELGGVLFDRAGVRPTVFGEIVLRHGRTVLSISAELSREITLTRGLDLGELTVAVAFYPADISGLEAAAILTQRHPNVAIDIRVMDWSHAKEAVLGNLADVAFADIRMAAESPDFDVYPIRKGPLSFFCSSRHPLARRQTLEFDELTRYPWVGPSLAPPISAAMPPEERPCCVLDKASGRLRPRVLVESFSAAKRIVGSGAALSAGLPFQIAAEVAAGELVQLPVVTPLIAIDYGFILKRGRAASPVTKAYMKIVRKIESALPR